MRTWSAWWPLLCVLTTNLVAVVYDCKSTLYLSKLEEYSPSEQTTSLARRVRRHLPECGEISSVPHGYSKSHGKGITSCHFTCGWRLYAGISIWRVVSPRFCLVLEDAEQIREETPSLRPPRDGASARREPGSPLRRCCSSTSPLSFPKMCPHKTGTSGFHQPVLRPPLSAETPTDRRDDRAAGGTESYSHCSLTRLRLFRILRL